MSKQIHYNIDNIDKEDALFNIILGEKSNGKSYQVKHKKAVEHYLKTGKRFILIRRWREDISNLWIEQYFADVDVLKLTNGKYNCITQYRKVLYLSNYNLETSKVTRGEKIGYVVALSTEQHLSSGSFLDVDIIIFEEFFERGSYLPHEPDRFMIFYSTIDRKRGSTKVYCVGNSISKVCPYIKEWGLDKIFHDIKQGEIKTKIIKNEDTDVKIAIEFCKASGGKSVTIGNAASMIDKGTWQTFPQPKLPKSYNEYEILYRFGLCFKGFKFIAEMLSDGVNICWFVYPYNKEFDYDIIVISDEVRIDSNWYTNIYNISSRNIKLQNILNTFTEDRIFYSSDLCGTDFKQVINFSIRR